MKKFTLISLSLLLGGCILPVYDPESIRYPPRALRYQQKDAIGNTDFEQRRKDMIVCGIPEEMYTDGLGYIYRVREGEVWGDVVERRKRFYQCMDGKGYTLLTDVECGSAKENRGKIGICT